MSDGKKRYCHRCLTTFTDDPENCTNLSCGKPRPKAGWGELLDEGDTLDRNYRILKVLAVGGAGLTYLARELHDSGEPKAPDLAIKVLYAQRQAGPFLQRLSNEAQILQSLRHPNIVTCHGFVHRTGKAPYLVTEFEHGGTLTDHLERVGVLPPKVAAEILRQILLALDEAHSRAVIHRDLKPDNVLLDEAVGRDEVPLIKLTDFGIAKISGGVGGNLTKMGTFVGTPEFAAPEQFIGGKPGPATDVFSAGAVIYALVTGQAHVQFTHRMDIEHDYEELLAAIPPKLPRDAADTTDLLLLQEILDNVMLPEPDKRWTIRQILARVDVILGRKALLDAPGTLELTMDGRAPKLEPPPRDEPAPEDDFPREDTWAGGGTPGPAPERGGIGTGTKVAVAGAAGGVGRAAVGVIALVALVLVGGGIWFFAMSPGSADGGLVELSVDNADHKPELAKMQGRLSEVGPKIGKTCKAKGKVPVVLVVKSDGAVHGARVEGQELNAEQTECVQSALEKLKLPRTSGGGAKARLLLKLE